MSKPAKLNLTKSQPRDHFPAGLTFDINNILHVNYFQILIILSKKLQFLYL